MSIEIENLLHALNLDRPDIAELPEGATISCNVSTLRRVATYLRKQESGQPVQKTKNDPAARLTELAEAQKRLDDAMAQLATAIPEREVRSLGSRINDLLAAFARATERESVSPPHGMGMRMQDIRVGMKMKSLYGGPEITVTELTKKGFKYSHPPYHLGARIGQTVGGEHYGHNGYSHYTQIEDGGSNG